jgi:hypothetical protein
MASTLDFPRCCRQLRGKSNHGPELSTAPWEVQLDPAVLTVIDVGRVPMSTVDVVIAVSI